MRWNSSRSMHISQKAQTQHRGGGVTHVADFSGNKAAGELGELSPGEFPSAPGNDLQRLLCELVEMGLMLAARPHRIHHLLHRSCF